MSKSVKSLITKDIVKDLEGVKDLAVVSIVGVSGVANNRLREQLLEKGIHVLVVKNAMAKTAFTELGISEAAALLNGPCALAYGGESAVDIVREMMDQKKDIPTLVVKGVFLDGEAYGEARMAEVSKFPTRIEALGRISAIAKSPGAKLVGTILGPGSILGGILKSIQEKHGGEEEVAA